METALLVIHVLLSLAIIGLVLLQRGKGAEAGAALGGGASATMFGARGAANFLSRTTAILAAAFIISSLVLANMATNRTAPDSVIEKVESAVTEQSSDIPVADKAPAAPSDVPGVGD